MLRKFNYTNRIRIVQEDIRIFLRGQSGGWSFDAVLNLAEYELPESALVCVEAYRQTTWMRFDFGTVGKIAPFPDRRLIEFDSPDDIRFRVRITSPGIDGEPQGLLLAEADRIPLRSPDDTQNPVESLLPVLPCDLGPQLWKLDFENHPRLMLNSSAGNHKQIGLDPGFVAVVYPAALREILRRILQQEHYRNISNTDEWCDRWLRFAADVLGVGLPPEQENEPEADDNWIDEAAETFARKHQLLEKFKTFWTEAQK